MGLVQDVRNNRRDLNELVGRQIPPRFDTEPRIQVAEVDIVRVTSTTQTYDRYPGKLQLYDADAKSWTDLIDVWVVDPEGEVLSERRYVARRSGFANERPVFVPTGSLGGVIRIREEDLSPSLTSIAQITLDQDQGLVLTSPETNEALVSIQDASETLTGVVSTSTQDFSGQKTFKDGAVITEGEFLFFHESEMSWIFNDSGLSLQMQHGDVRLTFDDINNRLVLADIGDVAQASYAIAVPGSGIAVGVGNYSVTNQLTTSLTIYGGIVTGATALANGSEGEVLTISGGIPAWAEAASGSLDIDGLTGSAVGGITDAIPTYNSTLGANRKLTIQDLGGFLNPSLNGGRLSLSTSDPTATDITGSSIYFHPFTGNKIALYDGTIWKVHVLPKLTLALSGLTAGKNYDIFVYDNSGTLTLEILVWTNDTTRATSLVRIDGVLCKSGDTTRRYLGTFQATGTTTTADAESQWFLWNCYNRLPWVSFKEDSANSWTDAGNGTWSAINGGSSVWKVEFVRGLNEDPIHATSHIMHNYIYLHAIALDSTSTFDRSKSTLGTHYDTGNGASTVAFFYDLPSAGYHYVQGIESTFTGVTGTAYGDNGGSIGGGSVAANSAFCVRGWR